MRILTGVVKAGAVALDDAGPLPDGARVTVIVDDDEEVSTARTHDELPVLDLQVRDEHVTLDEIKIQPFADPPAEPTVLVVEDDPDLSEVFGEVLEAAGYKVVTARDGRDALRYLQRSQQHPHAILLDVRMPNMDGITFRKEAAKVAAEVPVILTSADTNLDAEVAELDVAAFLPKPVGRSELVATVSRVCDDDDSTDS